MEEKPIKRRRRAPTIKQVKAIKYVNQGNSVRKALILAGYSIKTANKSTDFFKHRGVQNAIGTLKQHILDQGLSTEKIATKFKEWIDAQHKVPQVVDRDEKGKPIYEYVNEPDYDTQVKGYDRWKDVMDENGGSSGKVKRKLTIEEFISEDDARQ